MRVLQTKVFTGGNALIVGHDTTNEIALPQNISWELRFYCDWCGDEIAEVETIIHKCDAKEEWFVK